MANTITVIQLKYSETNAKPSSLNTAEPAYSNVSNKLWINDGDDVVAIGGKYYTDIVDAANTQVSSNTLVLRDSANNFSANMVYTTEVYSQGIALHGKINAVFNQANSGYVSQNSTGTYANSAYTHANAAYVSQNTTGLYANTAYLHANAAYLKANTAPGSNNSIIFNLDGGYGQSPNLRYFTGTDTLDVKNIVASVNIESQIVIVDNKIFAGIAAQSSTVLPNVIAQFASNSHTYTQVNQQNINGDGSADFVVTADVGSDTDFYTDMGMAGSTYNYYGAEDTPFSPLTGYFLVQGSTIGQNGGNMVLGTTTPSTNIKIIAGGYWTNNVVATITNSGFVFNKNVNVIGDLTGNTISTLSLYSNTAYLHANAAYVSQNTTGLYANTAYLHANASYTHANTKFASAGGTISGDVNITGNLTVTGQTQYSNVVNVMLGDNIIVLNADVAQDAIPTQNSGIQIERGLYANTLFIYNEDVDAWQFTNDGTTYSNVGSSAAESYANSAYLKANAAYVSQNTTGVYANTAHLHANAAYVSQNTTGVYANTAYLHANAAYVSQNTTGLYANTAYLHVNSAYTFANTVNAYFYGVSNTLNVAVQSAGNYANSAYLHANAAYLSQNSSGQYANSAYLHANAAYTSQNSSGQYANSAYLHANSAYLSQNSSGQYANSAYLHANAAYVSQNTTGVYANTAYLHVNSAYTFANTVNAYFYGVSNTLNVAVLSTGNYANSGYTHANAAYVSQNTTGLYANTAYLHVNSAYSHANSAYTHANAAYVSQNTTGIYANTAYSFANTANAYFYGVNAWQNTAIGTAGTYANTAYLHANSAYLSQNSSGQYANSAYLHANSAYALANTKFASAGGTISGDVSITGNLTITGETTYANTTKVNLGDNIITLNADIPQALTPSENAGIEVDRGFSLNVQLLWNESTDKWTFTNDGTNFHDIASSAAESYANSAYLHANSAYLSQNSSGQYANSAYLHANSAYVSQNTTGVYANTAYVHANSAYVSQNTTGVYANTAYLHANSAYVSQNSTGNYANSAYAHANGAYLHANSGYTFANTANAYFYGVSNTLNVAVQSTGNYANAAYLHANSSYTFANTANAYFYGVNAWQNTAIATAGTYANTAYLHANSAYLSQNSSGQYANSAYLHANASYVSQNTTGQYANSAYIHANNAYAFANTANAYFYGVSNTLNVAVQSAGNYANSAYLHANAAYVSQNTTGVYANSAYAFANTANTYFYGVSNTLNVAVTSTGNYANSAYRHANAAYVSQNTTGVYSNTAYLHANASYTSQNTTGVYANTAHLHANAAYVSQNTTGVYANAAFAQSNAHNSFANTTFFAKAGGNITGSVNISNNLVVSGNTNLGNIANVNISGGLTGQFLISEGNGGLTFGNILDVGTITYTANSVSLANGVYISGTVADIQTFGDYGTGGYYNFTDGTGAGPAWVLTTDFINVVDFNRIVLNVNYTQNSGHTVYVQMYNYTTSAWDSFGSYNGLTGYYQFALVAISSTDYISGGVAQVRLYHSNTGNALHETRLDYIALEMSAQGPQGPRGPTGPTGPTGPGVASGGTTGQILVKNSANNYDTIWTNTIAGDLSVTGNLTILGNTTTISANNLSIDDTIIYLGAGATGNIADIGFVGHFVQGNYQHTGVIRDATDGKWKFFSNVIPEPTGTTVDFSAAGVFYDTVKVGIIETDASANIGSLTYVGTNFATPLGGATNPIIGGLNNTDNYVQIYVLNRNAGANASSDLIAYPNNGTDSSGFIDVGITSNVFSQAAYSVTGPNEGYLFMSGLAGSALSGNLVIATDSTGVHNAIEFYTGGFSQGKANANVRFTTQASSSSNTTGSVIINGGLGLKGNIYADGVYDNNIRVINSANAASSYANSAYLHANSAYVSQNTTGVYANTAHLHANASFVFANTANTYFYGVNAWQNTAIGTAGTYANTAYTQANSAYVSQNTTGVYANSAFDAANTADQRAVTSGSYANAAFALANTVNTNDTASRSYANGAFAAANTADQRAVTSGAYANAAYARANTSLVNNADTSTTGVIYSGGLVSNTTVTVNTSAVLRATSVVATVPIVIDTWDVATYGAGKYFIKMEDTGLGATHAVELIVIEAAGTSYISEYGEVRNSASLGSFDATIAAGTLSLTWTPSQSATTLKMVRTLI